MTQMKGDTMKDGLGFHKSSNEDAIISNRVIAFEGIKI
jgi:hypothetical protein